MASFSSILTMPLISINAITDFYTFSIASKLITILIYSILKLTIHENIRNNCVINALGDQKKTILI